MRLVEFPEDFSELAINRMQHVFSTLIGPNQQWRLWQAWFNKDGVHCVVNSTDVLSQSPNFIADAKESFVVPRCTHYFVFDREGYPLSWQKIMAWPVPSSDSNDIEHLEQLRTTLQVARILIEAERKHPLFQSVADLLGTEPPTASDYEQILDVLYVRMELRDSPWLQDLAETRSSVRAVLA